MSNKQKPVNSLKFGKDDFVVEGDTIRTAEGLYTENRPDSFTEAQEAAMHDYRRDFVASSISAATRRHAIPSFKKGNDRVQIEGNMGSGGSFTAIIDKKTGKGKDAKFGTVALDISTDWGRASDKDSITRSIEYVNKTCTHHFDD